MNKTKKVTLTLNENDYNKLRAKLILKGVYSVSEWVRRIIKKFLAENPE